ncbi:MAG: hypothetical protein ACKVXR_03850 [Planctomycetota bacterium]
MARHKQLVCQHLERVSREFLQNHQALIRAHVRDRHGVYALYRGQRFYYVGLASDLRRRLKHHLNDRHRDSWDRFSVYLTIGEEHMREIEALVIRIVRPRGNTQVGKLKRSQNLAQALHAEYKERQRLLWQRLIGEPVRRGRRTDAPNPSGAGTRPRKRKGRRPVLAEFIEGPMAIRGRTGGKTVRARVRSDGSIRYAGKVYNSPSFAGRAARGTRACSGWEFWKYERAPGDWVNLEELRR